MWHGFNAGQYGSRSQSVRSGGYRNLREGYTSREGHTWPAKRAADGLQSDLCLLAVLRESCKSRTGGRSENQFRRAGQSMRAQTSPLKQILSSMAASALVLTSRQLAEARQLSAQVAASTWRLRSAAIACSATARCQSATGSEINAKVASQKSWNCERRFQMRARSPSAASSHANQAIASSPI